jgi:hypothetical protein
MAAGDILRDGARAAGRLMPLLLPGFAGLIAVTHFSPGVSFPHPQTFGGFLTLLLLLPFLAAVVGLLIQALRFVTFDLLVQLFQKSGVNEDSNDAATYALYANLSVLWGVVLLASIFGRWSWWWDQGHRIAYLVLLLVVLFALAWAAMLAYHRSHRLTGKPATRKRKTTRKKTE